PLMWKFFEDAYFDEPQLIDSPQGWVLYLPATDSGTGVFNEDVLFHQVGGRWRDIDLDSWKGDLAGRLPKDRGVWKGVPYDFRHMTVTTGLWRSEDGNCCPTGGRADVKLHIDGDRLAITSVNVSNKNLD